MCVKVVCYTKNRRLAEEYDVIGVQLVLEFVVHAVRSLLVLFICTVLQYIQFYKYRFFTRISTVLYFFSLNNLYLIIYIYIDKLLEDTRAEVAEQEHLALLKKEYEHFKAMLGQTQQARSKRSKNST